MIRFERRFNRAFSLAGEEDFVVLMLREARPPPDRAPEIRAPDPGRPAVVEV